MKHAGAAMILLSMVVLPALGYTLKKISDQGEKIAVNTNKIENSASHIKEMRSDIKDLLKAQNVKSSYELRKEQ